MLPTKGYFQDIECPYYNNSCGRPYCHFRHKKKLTDNVDELVIESVKEETAVIPTYRPTPKSELANIHNNKSHIPISYVPDLTFRPDRKVRPVPKIEKPTYKPTPLSILSSASKRLSSIGDENGESFETIKEIKQNIANMEYDPATSLQPTEDIDFEELDSEFAIIDEIIRSTDYKKKNQTLKSASFRNVAISKDCMQQKIFDQKCTSSDDSLKQELRKPVEKNDNLKRTVLDNKICQDESEPEKNRKKDNSKEKLKERTIKSEKSSDEKKQDGKTEKYTDLKKEKTKDKSELLGFTCAKKEEILKLEIKIKDNCKSSGKSTASKDNKKDRERIEKSNEKLKRSSNGNKQQKEELKDTKEKNVKRKDKEKTHSASKSRSRSEDGLKGKDHIEDKQKYSEKTPGKQRTKENSERKDKKNRSTESKKIKDENQDRHKSKNRKEEKEKTKEHSREKRNSKERSENRRKSKEHNENRLEIRDKPKDSSNRTKSKSKDNCKKTDKSNNKHKKINSKDKKNIEYGLSSEESINDSDNGATMDEGIDDCIMDVDLDGNEDETILECYKIFNEYKPPLKSTESVEPEIFSPEHLSRDSTDSTAMDYFGKKRIAHVTIDKTYSQLHPQGKLKSVSTPGQTLTNRYKLAKMAQANREQELLLNEIQNSGSVKRSAPTLLEAARARKIRKEQDTNHGNTNIVDDILQGSSNKIAPPLKPKIAPAQNVSLMAKAKERISKIVLSTPKTIAQTQKSPRVAHVPDAALTDIPDVLQADKSKLPVNVRTRFLTMLADECVKLYISKEEAFSRALNEEFSCYEKCKVLATYRNSAMLAVNRLRKEIQERHSNGLGLIGMGEDEVRGPEAEFMGRSFHNKLTNWILTEEELDIHGYPCESEECNGRVKIKNPRFQSPTNLDENQRLCCRCKRVYLVDDDGWPVYEEECLYHPLKKRTIRGEQTYLCCRSSDETGCANSDTHVSEGFSSAEFEGYQTTLDPESEDDPRNYAVYALDCEMCYTTKGLELTRVTIVDSDCKTVYESLVKPLNPIIDYNTRFSGITKEQMDRTSTSILQVQANILHLCNAKTILVGHSLESDMKALKIVHRTVIDTSVLFPHKMGLPHKRALKVLASEYLRKIIQNNISGHDSAEDAVTCMELLKWKLKEETKRRPSK